VTDVILERKEYPTDAPISVSNLAARFVDQDQLEQALIEAAEANEAAEEAQQRVAELELEVATKAGEIESTVFSNHAVKTFPNKVYRWSGRSTEGKKRAPGGNASDFYAYSGDITATTQRYTSRVSAELGSDGFTDATIL
jgi:hypothetical protein